MRRRGRQDEEDDDESQWGVSTGNVYLDITLDFRDDCIEWAQEHLLYAILIGSVTFLIVATLTYLFIHSWTRYLNRPSLKTVTQVYDLGYFPETKLLADYALQYISPRKPQDRTPFLFLQGAALCAIAERVVPADKRDYYLTAANYLKEAAAYNFLPERAPEGWFLLGKSLFHCGELDQCRDPLRIALEDGYPHTKSVYWYLSNAYFFGSPPDLQRARQYLQLYQEEPTALEEEIAESRLLEAMIDLHIDGIEAGEKRLAQVPRFEQFALMRHFVEGQIELFKARRIRAQAIDLETDPNPSLLRYAPVAPAPVKPEPLTESPIEPIVPPDDVPAVPAPVIPFDDAALRELMPPRAPPEPVLGMFDGASEVQQRIAELRLQYAQNVTDGEVILLPREETKPEPVQDSPPETVFDPYNDDPVMKRAREYRNVAADHYQRAINHFAEVIRMADAHVPWGRTARLLTGICYLEMEKGKAKEAETSFRSLIEAFPDSAEAAGANFLLAEHDRTMGNTEASFRSFAQAFRNLRRNPQYASLWLTKAAMMEQCKAMVRSDIEKRRYEETLKLLDLLNGVMPQDERVRLIGESYESWAALLQSQAETTFGEKGNQIAKDAESKWRQAGAAFAALAQLLSDTREFTDLLWRSAENYRLGKDYRNGIVEYRKFSQANMVDHRPELNLRLGEMYLHLDFLGEAEYVLEEALHDFPAHPLVPQIRLVLSHVYSERKDWDKAKALLQLNLVGEAAPSSGPYRDSMYELGKISFAQGDFDSAIPYLEDAVKVHPDAIQAADANYMLAHAYLKRADDALRELDNNPPEAVRRSVESVVQTNRYRALSYLDKTESILADRQRAMGLTEAEKLMLRNVYFLSCSLLLKMEQYEQVIPRLNTVATIYLDKEEALDALLKMAYAMRMVGRDVESQTTLRRAEVLLNQMEKLGIISDGTSWRRTIQRQIKQ
jgi:TolA-binding protein